MWVLPRSWQGRIIHLELKIFSSFHFKISKLLIVWYFWYFFLKFRPETLLPRTQTAWATLTSEWRCCRTRSGGWRRRLKEGLSILGGMRRSTSKVKLSVFRRLNSNSITWFHKRSCLMHFRKTKSLLFEYPNISYEEKTEFFLLKHFNKLHQ